MGIIQLPTVNISEIVRRRSAVISAGDGALNAAKGNGDSSNASVSSSLVESVDLDIDFFRTDYADIVQAPPVASYFGDSNNNLQAVAGKMPMKKKAMSVWNQFSVPVIRLDLKSPTGPGLNYSSKLALKQNLNAVSCCGLDEEKNVICRSDIFCGAVKQDYYRMPLPLSQYVSGFNTVPGVYGYQACAHCIRLVMMTFTAKQFSEDPLLFDWCFTHSMVDENGCVECPVLRELRCAICHDGGCLAHYMFNFYCILDAPIVSSEMDEAFEASNIKAMKHSELQPP